MIGLFLDHNDPAFRQVIDLAVSLLAVAAWFELFDGTQTIAMGCIRGLKDAKTTFLVGLGCYWLIGAPAAWWMAFHLNWGPTGVWWGLALGLACAAVSLTLAFEWKMKRMIRREPSSAALSSRPARLRSPVGASLLAIGVSAKMCWLTHPSRAGSLLHGICVQLTTSSIGCWLLPKVRYSTSSANGNGLLIKYPCT